LVIREEKGVRKRDKNGRRKRNVTKSPKKHRTPTEGFAQAFFKRLAGSQGSALSRPSQRAKSPFDSGFGRNQPKIIQSARRSEQASLRAKRPHGKPTCRIGFPLPCRFCIPSVCAAAVRATLMESVPVERIPLPLPFLHSLRLQCRSQDNRQRERPS